MAQKSPLKQKIIQELHEYFGFKTKRQAADFYGVSRQKYTGWYTYATPWEHDEVYEKVKDVISDSWLETGEGEMLKDAVHTKKVTKESKAKIKSERGARFEQMLDGLKLTKLTDAADFFGVSPQVMVGWKNGGWSFDKVFGKVKGVINPIWLFCGEGDMLEVDKNKQLADYKQQIQELNSTLVSLKKENLELKERIDAYKKVVQDLYGG